MPSKSKLDSTYMGTALLHSRLSKARRAQVGAVLVTANGVTLTGYNGTPVGCSNECETEDEFGNLETKKEVIHAELNCILKAAKEGVSCLGSTVYVTLSPCVQCSAMLINAGVKDLIYYEDYRNADGLELLKSAGISVKKFTAERFKHVLMV